MTKPLALYLPGPSYFDPRVREVAGWVKILEYQREAIELAGYDVEVAETPPDLLEQTPALAKYLTYGFLHVERAQQADLLVGAAAYGFVPFLAARKAKKVAYVWNNEEGYRANVLEPEYARFGQTYDHSRAARQMNTLMLNHVDHVIACSPWVKKTHAEVMPADRISIAFWGVDSAVFTPLVTPLYSPPLRILFSGGDPIRKGLQYLLQALDNLAGVELWIVGAAVDARLPSVPIRIFGMVPHERMHEIMRQAHVICIPTLEDGIAVAVQEGMASGLVPIATPDAAEVFEHGVSGFRVPFRDPLAIRDAIVRLRDNTDLRIQMSVAAWLLAQRQTWGRFKQDFAAVIHLVSVGVRPGDSPLLPFHSAMPWLKETTV